ADGLARHRFLLGGPGECGQREGKRAAQPWLTIDPDAATVRLDKAAADEQSQTNPAHRAPARLDAIEALEQVLQMLVRDADTLVGNAHAKHPVAIAGDAHLDRA